MRRALAAILAVLMIVTAAWAGASPAAAGWKKYLLRNPHAQLKHVNRARVSFGAPRLSLVPSWSKGCAKHANYMARTGEIGHFEMPGRPGYSAAGDKAASTSVLFWPPSDPFPDRAPAGAWSDAPYHQHQVLNPLIRRTGLSKGCMTTLRDLVLTPPDDDPVELLAWPGDKAKNVPRTISACNEAPSDPYTAVGWSCAGAGPAFYIYPVDPDMRGCAGEGDPAVDLIANRSGQQIRTKVVDSFSGCGWIAVTRRKLRKSASFTLTVDLRDAHLEHTFRTGR